MRELFFFGKTVYLWGFLSEMKRRCAHGFVDFFLIRLRCVFFRSMIRSRGFLCLKKAAEGKTHLQSENKVHQQPWLGLDCVIGGCQ